MARETVLQSLESFIACGDEERHRLAGLARSVHLPAGTMFYREGDLCSHFGLVTHGDIRVFATGSNGREITLYHVRDGQPCLVNMLCVFLGRGAMASAVADLPTDAITVPAPIFQQLIATSEAIRRFVFETMAARLVDVMRREGT